MDEKQTRLLTWLSVILLVAVGFLVFMKPPEKKAEEGAATWTKVFADASSDKAKALTLTRGDAVLHFTRDGDGWKVQQGTGALYAADSHKVGAALDAILTTEISDPVTEAGSTGTDFGLDPAVVQAAVDLDGATTPASLWVGKDTPVGYGTYVQTAEKGAIFSAHQKLSGPLAADGAGALADFRDRSVAHLSPADVSSVTLRRPGEGLCANGGPECVAAPPPLVFEKDAHGWWIAGPTRTRADESRISTLLQDMVDLRADAFLTPADSPKASPAVVLELKAGDQDQVFTFGPVADGSRVVQGPLQPEPLRVKDSVGEALSRPTADWADAHLLPVRTATATQLDVALGDQKLSATRNSDGWAPANGGAVLDALSAVRVDRRTAAPASTGAAWGTVTLSEGTTRKEEVQLFQLLPDGGRVAVDAAGGPPFEVPATELQRMRDGLKAPAAAPSSSAPDAMPEMPDMPDLPDDPGPGQK